MSGDERQRELADGNVIPTLGLGVWQVPDGPECENAVRRALPAGQAGASGPKGDPGTQG
jgi:diketogulonate reductase-like aldo/keto reductase